MLEAETWTALLSALKYINNINNSFVMHEHLGLETKDLQGGAVAFIYTSWYNIKQQGNKQQQKHPKLYGRKKVFVRSETQV